MPRGFDRLGALIRSYAPSLASAKYRCDVAMMPLVSPTAEFHQCMNMIPARYKVGVSGNLSNQTAEREAESRTWYSAQMDASRHPWDFPELEATRRFLGFLGMDIDASDLWPDLWTLDSDRRMAKELISPKTGNVVLGLAPGVTSNPGKELPPEWIASVLSLTECSDFQIVLLGSTAEVPTCMAVAQAIYKVFPHIQLLNLAGKTNVRELIECIKSCDLIFTQETATLHLATALQKPVVGIVGGGHYGRFYPWGNPQMSRVVSRKMDCYGCNWHCKYETIECIQEIPPAAAAAELNYLLHYIRKPGYL